MNEFDSVLLDKLLIRLRRDTGGNLGSPPALRRTFLIWETHVLPTEDTAPQPTAMSQIPSSRAHVPTRYASRDGEPTEDCRVFDGRFDCRFPLLRPDSRSC